MSHLPKMEDVVEVYIAQFWVAIIFHGSLVKWTRVQLRFNLQLPSVPGSIPTLVAHSLRQRAIAASDPKYQHNLQPRNRAENVEMWEGGARLHAGRESEYTMMRLTTLFIFLLFL